MTFAFEIHTPNGQLPFSIECGGTLYFLGANGGGKTRLAAYIESLFGDRAHRIAAHRALSLNPEVTKISEKSALNGLRNGYGSADAGIQHRQGHRWGNKAEISLLSDYDFVLQALFADQSNISLKTHRDARAGKSDIPRSTKFERLVEIWDRVLPHRILDIGGDLIQVKTNTLSESYLASDMSDGERAVFYLIGQTLLAASDSLLIFDEPELHVHRAIMARLWDELEAARPDCAFLVISHDLEFIASREGQKSVIRDFAPATGWEIEEVPDDSGFSEEIATLILGSRKPILFVEGSSKSIDQAIYRACYPDWTVIPRGSCEEVIHSVITMRANSSLTRVTCAGIVDADAYQPSERTYLKDRGIAVLPVSEIENLTMLPSVLTAVLELEGHKGKELLQIRDQLLDELYSLAARPELMTNCALRFCRRRIDRALKKIDLTDTTDILSLADAYEVETQAIEPRELAETALSAIRSAIDTKDAALLLEWFDNKGILAVAAKAKGTTKAKFEQWLVRSLRNNSAPALATAIREHLPMVNAS